MGRKGLLRKVIGGATEVMPGEVIIREFGGKQFGRLEKDVRHKIIVQWRGYEIDRRTGEGGEFRLRREIGTSDDSVKKRRRRRVGTKTKPPQTVLTSRSGMRRSREKKKLHTQGEKYWSRLMKC